MTNRSESNQPTVYKIRVKGVLDSRWADWLGGLIVIPQANGETLLVGSVVDQAALHGILDRIHGLNLPLISVCPAED